MPRITDERREARREQILEAARACLQEHGLEAVSMEMIIARSGLSTGAVYGYFKGKDDIINAVVTDGTAAMGRQLVPILTDPAPPPLPQFAEQLLRTIADFGRDKPGGIDRLLVVPARLEPLPERPRAQGGHPHRLPQTARAVRRDGPPVAGGRDVRPRCRPRRGSGAAAVGNPGVRRPAGTGRRRRRAGARQGPGRAHATKAARPAGRPGRHPRQQPALKPAAPASPPRTPGITPAGPTPQPPDENPGRHPQGRHTDDRRAAARQTGADLKALRVGDEEFGSQPPDHAQRVWQVRGGHTTSAHAAGRVHFRRARRGRAAARRAGSRLACRGLRVAPQPTSGDPGNLVRAGLSAKGGGGSPPLEAYTIS